MVSAAGDEDTFKVCLSMQIFSFPFLPLPREQLKCFKLVTTSPIVCNEEDRKGGREGKTDVSNQAKSACIVPLNGTRLSLGCVTSKL